MDKDKWPEIKIIDVKGLLKAAGRALIHFATQHHPEHENTLDNALLQDSDRFPGELGAVIAFPRRNDGNDVA